MTAIIKQTVQCKQHLDNTISDLRAKKALLTAGRKQIAWFDKLIYDTGREHAWFMTVDKDYSEHSNGELTIVFNLDIPRLSGFKDPALVQLIEACMDADHCDTRDYASAMNREFIFWFTSPVRTKVVISAYVCSDSKTCYKVRVSSEVRTYNDDKYEMICKD